MCVASHPSHAQGSQDKLEIHFEPDQDNVADEDEWMFRKGFQVEPY